MRQARRDAILTRQNYWTSQELGTKRTLGHHPMAKAWARAQVRESVWAEPGRGRPAHAFRAGFITGLRAAGAELEIVQHLVGHDPSNVTSAHYTDPAHLVRQLEAAVALVPARTDLAAVLPYEGRGWRRSAR